MSGFDVLITFGIVVGFMLGGGFLMSMMSKAIEEDNKRFINKNDI